MAISQTVITNRLDKKINYGKARTAFHAQKGPLNEAIVSPMPQGTDKFWVESHSIPTVSPSTNILQLVDVWQYATSNTKGIIEMTLDSTVSSGRTFLACSTNGDKSTRLDAWIPTTYGATYDVKFYIGPSGHHGNTSWSGLGFAQIFPSATGTEFYFDTSSGVLSFAGDSIPSGLISTTSLYLTKGWRYVGNIGLTSYIPTIASSLVIKEINDPVSNFSQTAVEELHFDVDSGFALTDVSVGGKKITKIAMESTFKHWNVSGQDQLTASGVDEITVEAGDGITLTTTAPPSTTQTYYVIVNSNAYEIWTAAGGTGTQLTSLNFISGGTYVFDTSHTTMASNRFELSSIAPDGAIYSNGITYGGGGSRIADGTAGAFLQIKGKKDTATTLYDFSDLTNNYTSSATISAQQKTLTIKNSIIDSSGNAIIAGNLTVHGTTTTVNSNITTIDDPIITLGAGSTTYTYTDDNKDRGIEFKWHDGTADVLATAIVQGTEYIIKTPGTTDFTLIGASDSLAETKFTANATTPLGTGVVILATASNVGFFGFDDSLNKFTYIPDGINASELYSGDAGVFDLSGTVIDEIKDVNVGTPVAGDDGKVLTWDNATLKFVLAQPGQSGLTLGASTDGTYNDGAYYQKNTVVSGGKFLTGVDTTGTVSDALDAVNETIKNIKINKYVQGAVFTVTSPSPAEGSASPTVPLTVRFSITDWIDPNGSGYAGEGPNGNATHADWFFEDETTPLNNVTIPNDVNTLTNGYHDQDFTSIAGGNINATMTLKCASGLITSMTEGSYMTYEKDSAVVLWTPNPEPSFSSNVTVVDLDSGVPDDRKATFDVSNSSYTHYWMMEFDDGTKYPTGASTTGDNTHVAANWAEFAVTTTHIHDYGVSSPTEDTRYSPKIYCRSTTAGGGTGNTQSYQRSNYIEGFIEPVALFTTTGATTGNNDEVGDTNKNGNTNTDEGHPVKFTNTTQNLGAWGDTDYTWDWDDGTTTQVVGGSGNPGDEGQIIEHYFTLADPKAEHIFDVTLTAENDRTSLNADTSTAVVIRTEVDPRADFSGTYTNLSTSANGSPSYHNNAFIGFEFVKYNPGVGGGADSNGPSNNFSLTNTSEGTDYSNSNSGLATDGSGISYAWDFGDSGTAVTEDANHSYTTSSTIARTVTLITRNDNSIGGATGTDDTEVKANYVTINPTPARPAGLTGLTIDIPTSDIDGTNPAMCADTTNNIRIGSSINPKAPGAAVTRVETSTLLAGTSVSTGTETLSGWANEFPSNGTFAAEVVAHVNDSLAGDGKCEFTGENKVGRYLSTGVSDSNGVLHIIAEQDANEIDSSIYPDNFYKQFKARIVPTLTVGYNILQLKHSDTGSVGPSTESDVTDVVFDDMTDIPTITAFGTIAESVAVYRYMSTVPFYKTGSSLTITDAMVKDLTGETYRLTTDVVRVKNETGTPITASDKTYTYALIGLNAIPNKDIGVSADHTCSVLALDVDGTGSGDDGVIQMTAHNVNGDATDLVDTTTAIRYWFDEPVFNENSIPMGITYGSQVGSNTVGHRTYYGWPSTNLAYPAYTPGSTDWWLKTWNSETTTIVSTHEAACYLDKIQHSIVNFSTGYLPVGPNLSTGRTTGTQYFTFAFQRSGLSKLAIKISGEVTSLHIAIPGYNTDDTSSLNGWLDCNLNYGGSGFPGANTNAGNPIGNGSNGVRRLGSATDQGTFDVNTPLTDSFCNLDLGEASTGSSTFPTVLVRFGVANTKSVTAISIENWNPEVGS